jgi:predicted dehydrogenase
VRTGIIGTGNLSPKVLQNLNANDTLEIIGGYDIYGIQDIEVFDSLTDLLVLVDAVIILDILSSTYDVIAQVVKYGKHVYVENLSLCSKSDIRKLDIYAYEAGAVIQVGLKQRFYNFYQDLEKYTVTPRILESSRYVKFNKKSTQLSVIDDLMLHDIDVALKLCNGDVKSIYSTAVGVYHKDPDVVNTRIEFYNGCVANLSASKISNKEVHQTKFFQNNTYCSIDFIKQILNVQSNSGDDEGSGEEWGVKTTYSQIKDSDGYVSMLQQEIMAFYQSITNNVECISGISQYLQLQSVTDKIKEQLERNFTTNA